MNGGISLPYFFFVKESSLRFPSAASAGGWGKQMRH